MLSELLRDWKDFDEAAHALGVVLGVFPAGSKMNEFKGVFWTANPLGTALGDVLDALAAAGFLEADPDEPRYRWNPDHPRKG